MWLLLAAAGCWQSHSLPCCWHVIARPRLPGCPWFRPQADGVERRAGSKVHKWGVSRRTCDTCFVNV